MNLVDLDFIDSRRLNRRQLIQLGAAGLCGWMLFPLGKAAAALPEDLELVASIPQLGGRKDPLLVFRDFVADPDAEIENHIRLQLSQRKDLLDLLKKKIEFKSKVKLALDDMQVQLMFVPQLPDDHAIAYHRYCIDIVDYFFDLIQTDNFYDAITIPNASYPLIPGAGKSAFLVHRLAKAYRVICQFTAESGRSVKFKVSGSAFSNHLGAVDLEIEVQAPGRYGLTRKPFTIWQNDTDNLYTLLAIPLEETLHYYLGQSTDRQIAASMVDQPPESLSDVRQMANEWMAVEESVVGGLVNGILGQYCSRYSGMPVAWQASEAAVPELHRYRYREKGLHLVERLGYRETIGLYMDSPCAFKERLFQSNGA